MKSLKFSSLNRKIILEEMAGEVFDLLIIGGGITGCGIALDAALRGMKTALVEMQDFAGGTSGRSTKLVHGGLRYLKQLKFKMVAETGKERAIVYENGPHVTKPEWMLLPVQKDGTYGKFSTSIGLGIYDFLAGVKKGERRKMLSYQETIQKEPLLKKEGLQGSGYYVEYRTDDARLTIEVIKEAVAHGVKAVNYAKVIDLLFKEGKLIGARIEEQFTGAVYDIYAKKIINAAGPWVDKLRQKDHSVDGKKLRLTKGVHIVMDQSRFPLKHTVYFDTPDGRMVFAIPRDGKTYVGTTDTFYDRDAIYPKLTEKDRAYLIGAVDYMFPEVHIHEDDIESGWAGVRPLIYEEGKDPSEISRKDEIWISASGMITIAGGKLTGYRKMAESVVDLAAKQIANEEGRSFNACQTRNQPISGGHFGGPAKFQRYIDKMEKAAELSGLSKMEYQKLVQRYGTNITGILEIANTYDPLNKYGMPLDVYVQIVYALMEEMAVRPSDFFIRRTSALYFNIRWVFEWRQAVIELMGDMLGWDDKEKESHWEELDIQLHDALHPNGKE